MKIKPALCLFASCVTLLGAYGADDIVIADFEGETFGAWKTTGTAFGEGPAHGKVGWQQPVDGYLGEGLVNSFHGGDDAMGTLTSPPFKIQRKFITFLIGGGGFVGQTCMNLLVDGKVVRSATGPNTDAGGGEHLIPLAWDVGEFLGRDAEIQIVDQAKGGWGHILVDQIVQTDARGSIVLAAPRRSEPWRKSPTYETFPLYASVPYDQALRPQFHFTSRVGWLNDPNGMVYYDGEWHMAFQHFAKGNANGQKSWGNAVSPDLVHWTQLPHAINPYPNVIDPAGGEHTIWSGSAVVDELNVLGKQQGDVKTLFALFTATHQDQTLKKPAFFQAGAYSTDKGRTWAKINDGKPIIEHQEGFDPAQRDPYMFFDAPSKSYRCIMEIGGPQRLVRIFKSTDLLHWEVLEDIPNKAAECINMFAVPLDGDPKNSKWVITDAGTGYEVGDYDGEKWTGFGNKAANGWPLKFEYGDCYYAAQVFNDAPDHRAVQIGWLQSLGAPDRPFVDAGMPFTQQMSIPVEITLRTTPDGIRMFRNPVKEIATLYAKTDKFENLTAEEANAKLAALKPELIDLTLSFIPAGDFTINMRGLKIDYDSAKKEFAVTNDARVEAEKAAMLKRPPGQQNPVPNNSRRAIPAPEVNGKVTLRVLVDRASLELFVNDGQAAASFVMVPAPDNRTISIDGNASMKLDSLVVNELKSTWPQI